ncbi:MAG: amidohydrolase [Desulfomonile tiedjei]|uniref:Amidohydrolase n=1 Tax=Desulfomonile tiedjei TaxID=2358 RepID=A0A9D6UYN8_9BACT|nr:amidohydrolase [Desulfomonile tiedjei]
MFIDSHCHIFTQRIVENMKARPTMVRELKLNVNDAVPRLAPKALEEYAEANGIDLCLLLPTAAPHKVQTENNRFIGFTRDFPRLRTLGTLHPMMRNLSDEILRVFDLGIPGFKFSSFSQRFDLSSPEVGTMLAQVERLALARGIRPVLVFDTFVRADFYFSADPAHLTTPAKLGELVHRYPGIVFIGAHMGGLLADFDELRRSLIPTPNLYLDTSNAAHTLKDDHFIELLRNFGPSNVLFGTDWPWFVHVAESRKIRSLLVNAGYDESDQAAVFGGNALRLFGF